MAKKNDKPEKIEVCSDWASAIKTVQKSNKDVEVRFGEDIVDLARPDNRISFGNLALDDVTRGGLVRGAIMQVFGADNAGKTLQGHLTARDVQAAGGNVVWLSAKLEPYDRKLAEAMLNIDFSGKLPPIALVQSMDDEESLNAAVDFVSTGQVDLLVVDAYGALRPKAITDKAVGEYAQRGAQANMLQQFIGNLGGALMSSKRTAVLAINQLRANMEPMFPGGPPAPPQPACAWAVKHADIARIRIEKGKNLPDPPVRDVPPIGRTSRYTGDKAKLTATHNRKAEAPIYLYGNPDLDIHGAAVDNVTILIGLLKKYGHVVTSGTWHSLLGAPKVNGDAGLHELLRNDKDLYEAALGEVKTTWFSNEAGA